MIKKILRKFNFSYDELLTPYYWIPYRFFQGSAFPFRKIAIEITYKCNLNCLMCPLYNWKVTKGQKENKLITSELELITIKKLLKDLKRINTKTILLTGGEPFLHKEFIYIIQETKKYNFYCSVLSNGTIMNNEIAQVLIGEQLDVLSISLDGPEEIHNKVRNSRDSYEKIISNISFIQDLKRKQGSLKPEIILNCTISSLNYQNLKELIKIAADLQIKKFDFIYLFYTTPTQEESMTQLLDRNEYLPKPEDQKLPAYLREIDIELLQDMIRELKEYASLQKVNISFIPNLKDQQYEDRFYNEESSFCNKCFYPWYATRISPNGDVYPCSINVKMGNVRDDSILKIWNNSRYKSFRRILKKQKLFPTCTKCCALQYKHWSYL